MLGTSYQIRVDNQIAPSTSTTTLISKNCNFSDLITCRQPLSPQAVVFVELTARRLGARNDREQRAAYLDLCWLELLVWL
jgi:hypothetical protein